MFRRSSSLIATVLGLLGGLISLPGGAPPEALPRGAGMPHSKPSRARTPKQKRANPCGVRSPRRAGWAPFVASPQSANGQGGGLHWERGQLVGPAGAGAFRDREKKKQAGAEKRARKAVTGKAMRRQRMRDRRLDRELYAAVGAMSAAGLVGDGALRLRPLSYGVDLGADDCATVARLEQGGDGTVIVTDVVHFDGSAPPVLVGAGGAR